MIHSRSRTWISEAFEPGIYLEDFGIRSEIDMYVDPVDGLVVSALIQREVPRLMQ